MSDLKNSKAGVLRRASSISLYSHHVGTYVGSSEEVKAGLGITQRVRHNGFFTVLTLPFRWAEAIDLSFVEYRVTCPPMEAGLGSTYHVEWFFTELTLPVGRTITIYLPWVECRVTGPPIKTGLGFT